MVFVSFVFAIVGIVMICRSGFIFDTNDRDNDGIDSKEEEINLLGLILIIFSATFRAMVR